MTVDRTNPRVYHNVAVGRKFQDAKGSAATPNVFMKECDFEPNPNVLLFDPQGTHGSLFKLKQGVRVAYNEPTMTLSYWLSRATAQMLENFCGGLNTTSGAQTVLSDATQITGLELSGVRFPDCMETVAASQMTIEISANGGNWDITVYKEAAKTTKMSEQLNLAAGGAVLTVAEAGYDLVLSGTLKSPPAAADYTLTVKQYTCVWQARPHAGAYQTIAVDDAYDKYTFVDCWTKAFTFTADGRTGIRVEEQIIAMSMVKAASDLTASISDNEFLAVRDMTLTYDSAGDNYSLPVEGGVTVSGEWADTSSGPDNAANPEFHDRDEVDLAIKVNMKWTDELEKLMDNARAATFKTLTVDYSYGNYGLSFAFPCALPEANLLPRGSGKRMEAMEVNLMGRADGSASPVNLCTVNVDLVA